MSTRDFVVIKVHKDYFDKCFEPDRKRIGAKLGVNFSQPKFTQYIANSGAKLKYPKTSKKFAPSKNSLRGFKLRI